VAGTPVADGSALALARAGFWRRFAAAFLDGLILSVAVTVAYVVLGIDRSDPLRVFVFGGRGGSLLISIAYFTYFHGRTGQTPGDAALSIRVVDLRDGTGGPIGYGRAFVRWLVSLVSGLLFLLGYLWMLWDSQRQTWHDKAAGSVVVHRPM
jgi:uncharacterized RDD family membrane protein YckC